MEKHFSIAIVTLSRAGRRCRASAARLYSRLVATDAFPEQIEIVIRI
jgi:hypothetical protein